MPRRNQAEGFFVLWAGAYRPDIGMASDTICGSLAGLPCRRDSESGGNGSLPAFSFLVLKGTVLFDSFCWRDGFSGACFAALRAEEENMELRDYKSSDCPALADL